MKKFLIFLIIIFGLLISPNAFAAEKINSFDAEIKINADASINVSERIEYDFGTAQKHGIFRNIPIKYQARGGNYNLRISDVSVTNEKGAAYKFTASYPENNIQIKIGDPDVLIAGEHTYIVNYTIKRAINFFNDHDELYWNITGNEWLAGIDSASAKIILPRKIDNQNIQTDCFAGYLDSKKKCNSILKGLGEADSVSFNESQMAIREGLTIVVGFPKGIVMQPNAFDAALDAAKDNGIIVLPFIIFAVCFYLWYARGRDPKGRGIIIAQYDPPDNLTPAEVGTIFDEKAQNKDITAEIVYLATQGYLKIRQVEEQGLIFKSKDFELELLKDDFSGLNEFQKVIISGLFNKIYAESGFGLSAVKTFLNAIKMEQPTIVKTIKLSDLKNKFYRDFAVARQKVYKTIADKGYFAGDPNKIRGIFMVIGAVLAFSSFFFGEVLGNIGTASLIASGIIIILFGIFMPARTKKGVEAKEYILGLKLYMSVAEARRMEFNNAPEKKPEVFEKLLPYAIALGVEKQWAKQFEGMYMEQPGWYQGPSGIAFNAAFFASSISDFSKTANSALASNSNSAAGGGSGFGGGGGGGFGGGGGGSW